MRYVLHDFQKLAVNFGLNWFDSAKPGDKQLLAAPTGTGKSIIEKSIQNATPGLWIVTPKVEIVAGILDKSGFPNVHDMSEDELFSLAFANNISTPIRLRNRLLAGEISPPAKYIFDESHHHTAESWQALDWLTGFAPSLGFTASPYRGTPKGTQEFRKQWGEPKWIITYPQAVERGFLSFPTIRVQPLLDDDTIEIVNGEFVVERVEAETRSIFDYVCQLAREYTHSDHAGWTRPTMFTVPSRQLAHELTERLNSHGMPAIAITDATKHSDRQTIFQLVVNRDVALVQVNTVSEGVDLPIRVQFDLAPVMSPVMFVQRFGRITRPVAPGEDAPEYVCCNRNVLRHAYLLEGCIPAVTIADATKAFGGMGKRAGTRVVGLEGVGRFKCIEIPFKNGLVGMLYCMSSVQGSSVTEYAAICHPLKEEPLWAKRSNARKDDGSKAYGHWQACEPPQSLTGFASVKSKSLSDAQRRWWKKDAAFFGLDAEREVSSKTFQALPILKDLRKRFK
jgi:hypothetical protein